MTSHRVPWGSYHASARIDTNPPYFFWNNIPWLGIALLKVWPLSLTLNWPVNFPAEPASSEAQKQEDGGHDGFDFGGWLY